MMVHVAVAFLEPENYTISLLLDNSNFDTNDTSASNNTADSNILTSPFQARDF
jgi:hypothetical protein